jgi:predicted TIM-barrel fold metal-dependent hydrolase
MDDIGSEVSRVMSLGLKGVKLHPDFQKFSIDEKKCEKLYSAIEVKLPLLIHTGDKRGVLSSPSKVPEILDKFPGLKMICAHFGGYTEWDEAKKALAGLGVWVDTCSSLPFVGKEKALELIEFYGEDKVIFGSDYPMWDPADCVKDFMNIDLSDNERELVLWKNAQTLLGI